MFCSVLAAIQPLETHWSVRESSLRRNQREELGHVGRMHSYVVLLTLQTNKKIKRLSMSVSWLKTHDTLCFKSINWAGRWPWKLESAKECVTSHLLKKKKKIISVKWVHSHIHLYLLKYESQAFIFLIDTACSRVETML